MTSTETLLFRVNGMPQGKARPRSKQPCCKAKPVEKERERGE